MLNDETALSPWWFLNKSMCKEHPGGTTEERDGFMVKVCTVNVGTLVRRSREVVEMLARRRVDICCLQEVRYRGKGATVYGDANEKYKSCGGMEAVMVWPEWA